MAVEQANRIDELVKGYHSLQQEMSTEEGDKLSTMKRIEEQTRRLQQLEVSTKEKARRLEGVNEVLTEAEKGYKRIEAAMRSLTILTQRQTKALKRQYRLL